MKRFATLLVGIALASAPSSAAAQTSECQTYSSETCNVSAASDTSLPFTGIDVPLVLAVGGGLVAVGTVTRRVFREKH